MKVDAPKLEQSMVSKVDGLLERSLVKVDGQKIKLDGLSKVDG